MEQYLVKMQHSKSVTVGIYFHVGFLELDKHSQGIAHLLEHLCFRKMNDKTNYELYQCLNCKGVTLHGYTNESTIGFYAKVQDQDVPEMLRLFEDITADYQWSKKEVEKEKRVVIQQILESPEYFFEQMNREHYFVNTSLAFPIMGTEKSVRNMDVDWIRSMKKSILNMDTAGMIMTGNYSDESEQIFQNLLKKYSDKKGTQRFNNEMPKHFQKRSTKDDLIIDNDSELSDIIISYDVDYKYNFQMVELLVDILAKGDGSKLGAELKDKKGWCGDVEAEVKSYDSFSRITIAYTVKNAKLFKALNRTFQCINSLKKKLGETDLEEVIRFYTYFPDILEDTMCYNTYIAERTFAHGNMPYEEKAIGDVYFAVTASEIKECANEILKPENLNISVATDFTVNKKNKVQKIFEEIRNDKL